MKYFRRAVPVLALTGIGLFAAPLAAAPRSIADCEKIQSADAYNQCLASFGPVAHLHGSKGASGGDGDGGEGGEAGASRHPYSHHGSYRVRHHGRQHMEIEVGSGHTHGHHRHGYTHHRRHHR
jgi:hypothetical protein